MSNIIKFLGMDFSPIQDRAQALVLTGRGAVAGYANLLVILQSVLVVTFMGIGFMPVPFAILALIAEIAFLAWVFIMSVKVGKKQSTGSAIILAIIAGLELMVVLHGLVTRIIVSLVYYHKVGLSFMNLVIVLLMLVLFLNAIQGVRGCRYLKKYPEVAA